MNYKKSLMIICMILGIFLCLSSVSAIDGNMTGDSMQADAFSNDTCLDENPLAYSPNDDALSLSAVYFDASASQDGDGSQHNPFKYLTRYRIGYGQTAYFAEGIYELDENIEIISPSTYPTAIIGQGQHTYIKSVLKNDFSFTVSSDSYLVLQNLTLVNAHINNQGNLIANNVIFRDTESFSPIFRPDLTYLTNDEYYDSTYGSVIVSDTPHLKNTCLYLSDCYFINNDAYSGGSIALYQSIAEINNCYFHNSSSTRFGGAIYGKNSSIIIRNSTFLENKARYGGVIRSEADNLTILDSRFYYSQSDLFGGAIASEDSNTAIDNCTFNVYESVGDAGGAIYDVNGTLKVYNSYFVNGRAYYGGAICNLNTNLTLYNSYFADNYAKNYGGAIYNTRGFIDIRSNSFVNSHAGNRGGAIFNIMTDLLTLIDNGFVNSTSQIGHIIYIDSDSNKVVERGNTYQNIYNLVCGYTGIINGQRQSFLSNYLTFSVSNTNTFVRPVENGHSGSNEYITFNIYHEDTNDSIIYTCLNQENKIFFDLLKHSDLINDELFELFIVDEAGEVAFHGYREMQGNENYTNVELFDLNFSNFMVFMQYDSLYDISSYSSVPAFSYEPISSPLPAYYDSRAFGYITPAKDQKEGGNCWAFSAIATLEACIKKATGITYDFSEENLKNLMSAYSLVGTYTESNNGGNAYMSMAYFASWFGPIFDENDVYDDYSSLSIIQDPVFHVQNIYFLPERQNSSDNDKIKRAIMDYGAVSVSLDWDDYGHAVTLVGWDDEYDGYDVFNEKATGAWIFKNSWGPYWKDNGFYYLSYDNELRDVYTFILNDEMGYSNIYEYDFFGVTSIRSWYGDEIYYRNTFTSKGDEILSAFSTFFDEPANYAASVYLNGALVTTQSGSCQAGYFTIQLKNEIPLEEGDEFSIEIKKTNQGLNSIPVSASNYLNRLTYSGNVSFYSFDGVHWRDFYDEATPEVACIKAFTRPINLVNVPISVSQFDSVNVDEEISIIATVPEYYVANGLIHYITGFIKFTINNNDYYALIENGRACLNITFDEPGPYTLKAQYRSNLEVSDIVSFDFNVVADEYSKIVIRANDVSKYYGGAEKYVATLTDNGLPLSDVNVTISVGNNVYTVKTNTDGQAVLDLNLSNGVYTVVCEYNRKSVSSRFTVKSTISVTNSSGTYLNSSITANLLDSSGKVLSYNEVLFYIGGKTFRASTNYYGFVKADIILSPGTYYGSVLNPATGEQQPVKLVVYKAESDCELTMHQNANSIVLTAHVSPVLATGHVEFIVDDKSSIVYLEDGIATLVLDDVSDGYHDVSIFYSGDENYLMSKDYGGFTLESQTIILRTYDGYSYYGYGFARAEVVDEEGYGFEGQLVKFNVNGKVYEVRTDIYGQALLNTSAFAVGNYSIIVEYESQSSMLDYEVKSTIPDVAYYGEYSKSSIAAIFIDSHGDLLTNQEVKFIIGDREFSARTGADGIANAALDLDAKSYTCIVLNPITCERRQGIVVISKTTPELTLTKTQSNNQIILTATFTQDDVTGNVIFAIGDDRHTVSITGGKAVLTLPNLKEGSYYAIANYEGDNNYKNAFSESLAFSVDPPVITLSAPSITKYYHGTMDFTVTLKANGIPMEGETVKVTFEGDVYGVTTDENGVASIGTVNLHPDVYTLTSQYGDKAVTSTITVKSTVLAKDLTCQYLSSNVNATFLDSYGNALSNAEVAFRIANDQYESTTDGKGVASVDVNLKAGSYVVTAVNPSTGEEKQFTLTLAKATPALTLKKVNIDGEDALMAELSYPSATGKITFTCQNKDYPAEIYDGVSYLKFSTFGQYDVSARYSGDSNFNAVSKSISVEMGTIPNVVVSSLTKVYGDSKQLVIRIVDNDGNPIAGRQVNVDISKSNAKYNTDYYSDKDGYVKVSCNYVPSTYTVKVTIPNYKTWNAKLVVKKATPKITAGKKTFKIKVKTKKYTVTLKNQYNKVLKSKKVTLKVAGKTYSAKTNSKGQATFKITKLNKRGTFKAVVKFGDSYFNTVSKTVKITVKK